MPSFSKLLTSLTGFGFGYLRDSRHAAHTFGQQSIRSNKTVPRFGFQYFVTINLNVAGTQILEKYQLSDEFQSLFPLIKSVELPAVRIDTGLMNEYNRKRISQTKVNFEPIKMVFHDVVDGRTMKLWQMYYEFYFNDGNADQSDEDSAFGYNIGAVKNDRYLFKDIEIVQVHNGRFNKVTLVNPRVSSFTPSGVAYDDNTTTDFTLTFEYEYLRYDISNERLTDEDKELFEHGEFMDLPSLAIATALNEKLESLNPLLKSDNPLLQRVGRNVQGAIGGVISKKTSGVVRGASSKAQDGLANIKPKASNPTPAEPRNPRNFKTNAKPSGGKYADSARSKFDKL